MCIVFLLVHDDIFFYAVSVITLYKLLYLTITVIGVIYAIIFGELFIIDII